MSNIVNLKQVRKNKARDAKATKAADNRIEFGRTKAEKKLSAAEKNKNSTKLDGHKLDKE